MLKLVLFLALEKLEAVISVLREPILFTTSPINALIGEVVNKIGSLNTDITASNFSKARNKTNFNNEDIASSLSNMVGEVIGTVAYLNALLIGVSNVYFIGRVSKMNIVKNGIEKRLNLAGISGNYIEKQEFGNVIGAIAYLNANT